MKNCVLLSLPLSRALALSSAFALINCGGGECVAYDYRKFFYLMVRIKMRILSKTGRM